MPEVSIVTALHNCVELTRAYVDSLKKCTNDIDWELILVDDASSDDTHAFLKDLDQDKRIRVVYNEHNLGFAASNNKGASFATAEILAFLNNDLLLSGNWLKPMLAALQDCEKAGVIGNVQRNPRTDLLDHAGVFFGLDGMPRQARKNRKNPPKQKCTEWFAVTAACMLIRKHVFHEVGGFDDAFRNGFEDIDLCVKLREKGYKHYVCNDSVIHHCVSASPGRHNNNNRNSELFRERWAHKTYEWGEVEWAPEYLQRYARHWWKFNFRKWVHANFRIIKDLFSQQLIYRK